MLICSRDQHFALLCRFQYSSFFVVVAKFSHHIMSHSLYLKTKACRKTRTDASVATSGAKCMENITIRSNETGKDVHLYLLTTERLTLFTVAY